MSNNRMFLVHDATGQRILLAKHWGRTWTPFNDHLSDDLQTAFEAEASESGWPSTGWHLEFAQHSKHDHPLMPTTTQTWEDDHGRWRDGNRQCDSGEADE